MNKGMFPNTQKVTGDLRESMEDNMVMPNERIINQKVAVCRNIGLATALKDFKEEIGKDAKAVNSGITITFILLAAHFLPLNILVANPKMCIPLWLLAITLAMGFTFATVCSLAMTCNDMIQSTTVEFLHTWQKRLIMLGWSGGFTGEASGTGSTWAYLPQDPEMDGLEK